MPKETHYGQLVFMLEEKWQRKLSTMPKSGVDYQIVNIYLKDGRVFSDIPVVDFRLFAVDPNFWVEDDDIADITMRGVK